MLEKKFVLQLLKNMPDEFTIVQLIEKLNLMYKIQQGLKDIAENRTYKHTEILQRIKR